jgi:hypothetical protein
MPIAQVRRNDKTKKKESTSFILEINCCWQKNGTNRRCKNNC